MVSRSRYAWLLSPLIFSTLASVAFAHCFLLDSAVVELSLEAASDLEEEMAALGSNVICEDDLHLELPLWHLQNLHRRLNDHELKESFTSAGLLPPVVQNNTPLATWIIGPSASGKSFVSAGLLNHIERPVVVDGDAFRSAHMDYQAAVWDGKQRSPPCVWKSAWETVKPNRGSWRTELWENASQERRNLVVVDTCSDVQKCITSMNVLKALGYKNDVYAVGVKESLATARGMKRAAAHGKRFGPTYNPSMRAIIPVIENADGKYVVLDNSKTATLAEVKQNEIEGTWNPVTLASGTGFSASTYPAWTSSAPGDDMTEVELAVGWLQINVSNFVEGIENHSTGSGHLPDCVKDLGRHLGEDLVKRSEGGLTEAELAAAQAMSQLDVATAQEKPVALWVLGAAAVGKSTAIAASALPGKMGLEKLGNKSWDAVTLDGEFYRETSSAFKAVVDDGLSSSPPCIWKAAWSDTKARKQSKSEKRRIFEAAIAAKKNIIIPSTCASGFDECLKKVEYLKAAGYVNHLLAVNAKTSIIDSRGMSRADFQGKSYNSIVKESTSAFVPMIAAINGKWEMFENTGHPNSVAEGAGADQSTSCAKVAQTTNPYLAANRQMIDECGAASASTLVATRKLIAVHRREIEEQDVITDHLPMCEDFGSALPAAVAKGLDRNLNPDEFKHAQDLSNIAATKNQAKPVALWLMGASAVGKSTASRGLLDEYGIPQDASGKADAVQIDGEIFRTAHKGFADMVRSGLNQTGVDGRQTPCLFRKGWKGTRARDESKVFKKTIFKDATANKQHLIIPSPCASNLAGCIDRVEALKKLGYTNHIVAIYARKELVNERGRSRADRDGKMYLATHEDSAAAFAPMIAASNGQYTMMDNTGRAKRGPGGECPNLTIARPDLFELERHLSNLLRPFWDLTNVTGGVLPSLDGVKAGKDD